MTGKACWYRESKTAPWRGGTLLHWGLNYEEFEAGPGNFTVAVIVDDETQVVTYHHANDNLCFAAAPPSTHYGGTT
ncbi:hypothetical protein LCGC14_0772330 [marine sediment metagenome]|uniref:Uncharacterized protein n=1 Tax=marine sediment metagenome TaxID=412755 RepID=A0A0F9T4R8_9ZZZZ